jgi:hypothetical protein
MNRPLFKRVFPQALIWTAAVALFGAMAPAQDTTAPAASAAAARSDGQIEMDVVHALDASKALKDDMITAATIQSEVTLSGTVSTEASSELAESIAARVQGVTKVNNNLKIGNPQAAAVASDQQNAGSQPEEDAAPAAAQAPAEESYPAPAADQGQYQAPPPPPPPPARPAVCARAASSSGV